MLDLLPDDARVIPGHGEATDVAGLRTYVAMIEDTLARVRKELSAGRTAAQMVEADLFKDLNARWGGGFISPQRWIETLVAYAQR